MVEIDFYQDIIGIIKKFGDSSLIFRSEAQFQFKLAWELQKKYEGEFEVFIENLSAIAKYKGISTISRGKDKGQKKGVIKTKKFFTDIILKNNDGYFVAIELKYKTDENDEEDLYNHGAQDLGRFDFLWDLMRIQILKNGDNNCYDEVETKDLDKSKMIAGYSILLTNDEKYWSVSGSNLKKRKNLYPLYKNFCIGEKQTINADVQLEWNKNGKADTCVDGTWRDKAIIKYDHEHNCYWRPYCKIKKDAFNYMILSVEGNEIEPKSPDDKIFEKS